MKRMGFVVLGLSIGAFLGTPAAMAQNEALPAPVRAYQQELADVCREIGGRGDFGEGFIQRADFDGDGADDYFLDTGTVSCPPASASAGTCGSAGCVVAVFLSSQGYREVWGTNVQDYEILTGDKVQLSVGMHGSACGRSGADACNAILEWDGRTFAQAQRRAEGPASASVAPEIAAVWNARPDGSGIITARTSQGPAPLRDIGVSCHDGRPLLAVRPDSRMGGSATLGVAADGRTAQMPLMLDARTGIYFGLPASPPILMLLAGGADQAEISINGRRIGAVALQGAPTAMAEALAPCWRGQNLAAGAARQNAGQASVGTEAISPTVATPAAFPPVPEGFYAVNETCAGAARDEHQLGYMHLARDRWQDWDAGWPLTQAQDLGGGRWALHREDEPDSIEIQITGPDSFMQSFDMDDGWDGRTNVTLRYTHCPIETVPAAVRQGWARN